MARRSDSPRPMLAISFPRPPVPARWLRTPDAAARAGRVSRHCRSTEENRLALEAEVVHVSYPGFPDRSLLEIMPRMRLPALAEDPLRDPVGSPTFRA